MIEPKNKNRAVTTVNIPLGLARDLEIIKKQWQAMHGEKTSKSRLVNHYCRRAILENRALE